MTETKPSTESHKIADNFYEERETDWFIAKAAILEALNSGDLLLPSQQAEAEDPDLVNARILATKVSDTGIDYTDGEHDYFSNVQSFYKALKSGLIKMGDRL